MASFESATTSHLFKHSRWDAVFVCLTALEVVLRVVFVISLGAASVWLTAGVIVVLIVLNAMNYECAGHYFIHRPFFRSLMLNRAYSIMNSLAFGFPQTFYRTEHLCHHRYNNDYPDPETGRARDRSSIYQHGPAVRQPESPAKYAFMSAWRQDVGELFADTPKRLRSLLIAEIVIVGAGYALALLVNPVACFVLVLIAGAGSAISNFQNWLEHAHADPRSRLTDSVSCYGRFYNFVWFNNGYHQEHHYAPGVHWTQLPKLKSRMLPDSQRRVVPHAHLWNLKGS